MAEYSQYQQQYAPAPQAYVAPQPTDPYAHSYGHPPPAGYAPAPVYASYSNPDEVRTIFITGFPDDVKEREVNNLLRFLPGYEASQMHWKNGQAQGFALFSTGAAARAAIDAIHNLVFDTDSTVLRCELARKNMYVKEDPASKRGRYGSGADYPSHGYPPAVAPGGSFYGGAPGASPAPGQSPSLPRAYVAVTNTKDNPPCNTLFIGNLGDTTSEKELQDLFGPLPGFRQLKLIRGAKGLTCFIEFVDVPTAMAVHQQQQGAVLTSSDRGGIRIQYSKNPFGRKRDFQSYQGYGGPQQTAGFGQYDQGPPSQEAAPPGDSKLDDTGAPGVESEANGEAQA